jgi:hypothetical protein
MDPKSSQHFYFGNLPNSGIVNESGSGSQDKTSSSYIILQNDFFHKRNKELETEISELNAKLQELEDETESLETSKTSLKGYIKNEGEYSRLSKNLVEIYDTMIGTIPKHKDEIEWNIKFLGISFIVFEFCLFLYKLYSLNFFGIVELLIINGVISYIGLKIFKPYTEIIKIRNIRHLQSVIKIKEGMKDASRGNDYLTELIDRL